MTNLETLTERCKAYYRIPGNEAGGCLHVVLDAGNMDAGFILHAYHVCVEAGDIEGKAICDALMEVTEEERDELWQTIGGAA